MIVSVDPTSPVPVFEQLRAQIERLIGSGALAPGDRLPTIRHLAADLNLARGTVSKVYEELARDGLVRAAGRHGTVVEGNPPQRSTADIQRFIATAADGLALVAIQVGLSDQDTHRALDAALSRLAAARDA